jgi:hypothetical protein
MDSSVTGELILIPFGRRILAFSGEDFKKALTLGQEIAGIADTEPASFATEKLMDAEGAREMTGIPSSWFLEAARQGRIPYIKAGKYVRFRMTDLIEALEVRPGHKVSMAFDRIKGK